jgi:hypothetical protein
VGEPAEHGEPAADGVGARRQALVRQRLPGRVGADLLRREQRTQRGGQVVGLAAGGGDGEHRPAGAAGGTVGGERRDGERAHGGRCGQVEPIGVGEARHGEITRAGQPGVAQGGGEQAGQRHLVLLSDGHDGLPPGRLGRGVWRAVQAYPDPPTTRPPQRPGRARTGIRPWPSTGGTQ